MKKLFFITCFFLSIINISFSKDKIPARIHLRNAINAGLSAKEMCSQKKFLGSKQNFNFRENEGKNCMDEFVASVAELICPNASKDYLQSHCHMNAMKTLGGHKPSEKLKTELKNILGDESQLTGKLNRQYFCEQSQKVSSELHTFCQENHWG